MFATGGKFDLAYTMSEASDSKDFEDALKISVWNTHVYHDRRLPQWVQACAKRQASLRVDTIVGSNGLAQQQTDVLYRRNVFWNYIVSTTIYYEIVATVNMLLERYIHRTHAHSEIKLKCYWKTFPNWKQCFATICHQLYRYNHILSLWGVYRYCISCLMW